MPIGDRAGAWVEKYLTEARPQLIAADTEALFLSDYGQPIKPEQVADKVKRYLRFAGVDKPGATHLLRHACATHMLEGGADIRFIQEMLGHANCTSRSGSLAVAGGCAAGAAAIALTRTGALTKTAKACHAVQASKSACTA